MAASERDCEAMIDVTEQNKVKLMITYRLHFHDANLHAVEVARSGNLGDLRYFTSLFGIRVDGAYNRFGLKAPLNGNVAYTSVTGNLVYKFPSATVSPYAIGGAGWCHTSADTGFGSGSDNNFCWNAGGGISMPLSGFDTFIEARYNQIQTQGVSTKFIPITFGVMF